MIATSAEAGLRVLLDLSPYRNLLTADGLNPYVVDWTAYLTTAAARVNTRKRNSDTSASNTTV